MKRSGFQQKRTKPLKRSGFKKPTKTALKRKNVRKRKKPAKKAKKREKLPAIKTMRNKCDKLLTPIIKEMYPYSIFSGQPTEVAHHFIKKSQSTALRYYIPNLIPLTHAEHQALHANESYWSGKIIEMRGLEWFQDLEQRKNETVKADIHFYIENYERLRSLQAN